MAHETPGRKSEYSLQPARSAPQRLHPGLVWTKQLSICAWADGRRLCLQRNTEKREGGGGLGAGTGASGPAPGALPNGDKCATRSLSSPEAIHWLHPIDPRKDPQMTTLPCPPRSGLVQGWFSDVSHAPRVPGTISRLSAVSRRFARVGGGDRRALAEEAGQARTSRKSRFLESEEAVELLSRRTCVTQISFCRNKQFGERRQPYVASD